MESERRFGGDTLAKAIANLETAPDIDRYHIVAHSHGGNVALHALRNLAECPKKLGATIFLGTPVLSFWRMNLGLSGHGLLLLLYASGMIGSIIAARHFGQSFGSLFNGSPIAALFDDRNYPWCILLAAGFALFLLVEFITKPHRLSSIYGSGHPHAFEFAPDEAMKALRLSLEVAKRPGDVLKQLYSTEPASRYAVHPPRDGFWKGTWSRFRTTAICRLHRDSGYPHLFGKMAKGRTAARSLAIIFSIIFSGGPPLSALLFVLDILKVKLPLADPIHRAAETIPHTLTDLIIGIALFSLMVMLFWQFLLVSLKLLMSLLAWLIRRPGAWIMGLVIRNAAFGGQCTHVSGPHDLPEMERAHRETISPELNRKMNDLSTGTAALAGQALYYALSEGDATQLRQHILARLTDPKLAHCQYYCEDEIVDRIAYLVALPVLDRAGETGRASNQ